MSPRDLTPREERIVIVALGKGYGVEDIAVTHGLPVASVRALVRTMKTDGTLKEIYRSEGKK